MANFLEGINVSGEYIDTLKDKNFTVLICQYRDFKDFDNKDKPKRKLVLKVRISNGQELDYFPNKTSQKSMAKMWGIDMDEWIGKSAVWAIKTQLVRGEDKKILFVVEPVIV